LFLQSNAILKISNLSQLKSLQMINLSNNLITRIENLAGIPALHTLELGRNRLTSVSSMSHLLLCRSITVLDLSFNRLNDPRCMAVWEGMPCLHVIYLQGNPVTQKIADVWGSYRKYMLARLPHLTYLDERYLIDIHVYVYTIDIYMLETSINKHTHTHTHTQARPQARTALQRCMACGWGRQRNARAAASSRRSRNRLLSRVQPCSPR
jgi:hypothetical protein